jgi:hypothetical protein
VPVAPELPGLVQPEHVRVVSGKLGLPPPDGDNRRVLAVLRYLGT